MEELTNAIQTFGFPIVMAVGMGYFVYFVYQTILNDVDPAINEMKITIIRLIDQLRLLDQDMIRLQEKVRADAQEALEDAQREAENTTLAKFLRNLESRIYSTLAKDISESLFNYENPATAENPVYGEIELEGNIIQWLNNGTTITLTIIEMMDGVEISRTTITIPVGSFGGCTSDCG